MTTEKLTCKALTRYALLYLPCASYLVDSASINRIRTYKSKQKAFKALAILAGYGSRALYLENGDKISIPVGRLESFYRQFECVKAFTLVDFRNGDKLLHTYIPIYNLSRLVDSSSITLKDKTYFTENPKRVLYENTV